jgi:phosphoglycolate phosphatase
MDCIELYIFDLDGTLVDSFKDIACATNRVLTKLGLTTLPETQIMSYVGQGAQWLLSCSLKAAGDPHASLLTQARQLFLPDYMAHLTDHTKPFPGVVDMLQLLHTSGATLAICTNKPLVLASALIQQLDLKPYFATILGGDSLETKKPDPAPLLHIMRQFSISPRHTAMIGDSSYDILAGRRANTWTCGVVHAIHQAPELLRCAADLILDIEQIYRLPQYFRPIW